ncbi:MAG: aromatic amino acid ammonia-lyase [Christiangramia sp.]|uniref:HAL/PAL/TAL family ammonia-lyase n=1 Tax=Christiangramia sp. TaxID=1931228 RepID=UPI003242CF0A
MLKIKKELEFQDFYQVLFENKSVEIEEEILQRVDKSFEFLQDFSKDKIIYGVNTGFGPMAQYRIPDEDCENLQYNLIRSHAAGAGKPLSAENVRALMLARMNTLALGKSGIHRELIETMQQLLNKNVVPLIFEHGGVGASGDLVQLAHLALVLIGEGEVFYDGNRQETRTVFKNLGINPISIHIREGLALLNGTSAMTGIGLVNLIYAKRLMEWSVFCSSAINEIVEAYDDHFSEELNSAKKHRGQQKIARMMREHLADSHLTRKRHEHLYEEKAKKTDQFSEKVQEYYSLRCVPQVLGPVYDTIEQALRIHLEEVNSANDNPIIDAAKEQVFHGGNFHGDYISLENDKLRLVVAKMSMLAERQLNYLLNPNLNNILPAFVNLSRLGLNFGMQGAQFAAVSTTAENQMLSNSMYVHSIPNNNDNQDIVSMGANSALLTRKVIDNAFEVLSVEIATIVQALYYLKVNEKLSSPSLRKFEILKKLLPALKEDQPIYKELQAITEYLKKHDAYS